MPAPFAVGPLRHAAVVGGVAVEMPVMLPAMVELEAPKRKKKRPPTTAAKFEDIYTRSAVTREKKENGEEKENSPTNLYISSQSGFGGGFLVTKEVKGEEKDHVKHEEEDEVKHEEEDEVKHEEEDEVKDEEKDQVKEKEKGDLEVDFLSTEWGSGMGTDQNNHPLRFLLILTLLVLQPAYHLTMDAVIGQFYVMHAAQPAADEFDFMNHLSVKVGQNGNDHLKIMSEQFDIRGVRLLKGIQPPRKVHSVLDLKVTHRGGVAVKSAAVPVSLTEPRKAFFKDVSHAWNDAKKLQNDAGLLDSNVAAMQQAWEAKFVIAIAGSLKNPSNTQTALLGGVKTAHGEHIAAKAARDKASKDASEETAKRDEVHFDIANGHVTPGNLASAQERLQELNLKVTELNTKLNSKSQALTIASNALTQALDNVKHFIFDLSTNSNAKLFLEYVALTRLSAITRTTFPVRSDFKDGNSGDSAFAGAKANFFRKTLLEAKYSSSLNAIKQFAASPTFANALDLLKKAKEFK